MKTNKINPCPFCNCSNVELHRNFDYVFCKNCGRHGTYFDGHPIDAINSWNGILNKWNFSIDNDNKNDRTKNSIK